MIGLPFALVPRLHLTADRRLMGPQVKRRAITVAGALIATTVSVLAGVLLVAEMPVAWAGTGRGSTGYTACG